MTKVRQDRRKILIGLGAIPLALATGLPAAPAQTPPTLAPVPDFPNPTNFRSGDLLWPKRKGAIVPRTRSLAAPPDQESRAWEAARQQLLADPAVSQGNRV